ncbi:fructose-1,6-bisphosphate aldolase/phosphatase [Thermofilum pendens]|uniref:Fructose-1,6-bisphosphate aldolase/phosphatase n=1 Tax=Thermofilum pendens (strain DSM 2475 / Hrk 5) TaxID=368408 RepID=A1RWM6_THEPD|nr:fructose-1,6-bisphosphate aldolase/phosphatase [Thermofilum pendens]ABL77606.1 D-fructose 1,6-bisphosphatase [Thermofilum pendens Hrk 5]
MRITVSLIKADVGGLAGHVVVHPKLEELARKRLEEARETGLLIDFYVYHVGDDLQLLMTHTKGENNAEIHKLAWDIFVEVTEKVSKPLKLYGAGQDLLKDTFSGNIKGMGPGCAEMEFEERRSEPILVFSADKTEPGAWNYKLYRIFADPFNTAGLIIDPAMHSGFIFEVVDVYEHKSVKLSTPEESYDLLALIGTPGRYVVKRVYRKSDGEIAAVSSATRLSLIAGRYVGKDDPVLIIRAQHGFPATGEVLEAFAFPHLVAGWMRGSHTGPLMPVPLRYAQCTRFDGPPRVVGLGFQLHDGRLEGPVDLFDDPAFEMTRRMAEEVADYMRRHGPFMPHRLGPEEMEYTTLPSVLEKLKARFVPAEAE